jgi:hypothetical protein
MSWVDHARNLPRQAEERRPQVVQEPIAHEGFRRALIGSFDPAPALPDDFTRLLDRLR